jgi:hypothetical protein
MSYPINAPVNFVNSNGGTDELNFNADGPTTNVLNKIRNFVTTSGGDLVYRAVGANNYLERLAIGNVNDVLTSDGTKPVWGPGGVNPTFTAYVTGSIAGIPTSHSGGANPGIWFSLNSTYITWSTASPGNDPDGIFNTVGGIFTAPSAGYYSFDAVVTFDSGPGVNAGSGLPAAPLPSGMAVRQAQIWSPTLGGGTALATVSRQVEGFNNNDTAISICVSSILLSLGDTVTLRVRHDRTGANTVTIGNPLITLPTQTYFTGRKIR